jgi:hypothetical protein
MTKEKPKISARAMSNGFCLQCYWSCQWKSLCIIVHSPFRFSEVNMSEARAFVPANLPDHRCTSKCKTMLSMISIGAERGLRFGAGPFSVTI